MAFKVYLTEEQWARVCATDEEVRAEVAKQQPEMYARLPAAQTVTVQATPEHQKQGDEESPVADRNASDAVEQINNMRSKEKLQHIIDNDQRASVRNAAERRLAAI